MPLKSDGGWDSGWPTGPDGTPLTTDQIAALGLNVTGGQPGATPNADKWKLGARPNGGQWSPPEFLQTYGNYTGLFPSLGQQVGQSLNASIQAQPYTPSWTQRYLPPRQNSQVQMGKYSPFQLGTDAQGGTMIGGPNMGGRTMGNPFPLNGKVPLGQPNIGTVSNATNPFIGGYQGLGGFQGAAAQQMPQQQQQYGGGQQSAGISPQIMAGIMSLFGGRK